MAKVLFVSVEYSFPLNEQDILYLPYIVVGSILMIRSLAFDFFMIEGFERFSFVCIRSM